jgi:hypothetical protein
MGVLTVGEVFGRVNAVGGSLRLDGERVKLRLPGNCPAESAIVECVRANRDAIASALRDSESQPPSLEEVKAMLPPGIQVLRYQPKTAPFAVAPVSVVTDAGKFFRFYLKELAWRLKHPDGHAAAPLADILAKLGDAGMELRIGIEQVKVTK